MQQQLLATTVAAMEATKTKTMMQKRGNNDRAAAAGEGHRHRPYQCYQLISNNNNSKKLFWKTTELTLQWHATRDSARGVQIE